ncbi:MAG: peptide chain release factor 2 [Candidatus Staskawiczbacteria bacterium]|nr:peptide chain release factor 2 [Candidatus Staskawiczbacteria bacterium]
MEKESEKIKELESRLHHLVEVFDVEEKEKKLKELEKESSKPEFWDDSENAGKVQQEISEIKNEIESLEEIKKELEELKILEDESLIKSIQEKLEKQEFKTFLSGKYDKSNAIMEIFSGAGGQDSQDWATMLLRMYERYCANKGFKAVVLHQQFGQGGGPEGRIGIKSVTMEITGSYAYGFLKKESGVHRLVRISPFNAQKLRHTSFALVNVLPEVKANEAELEISPSDLKVDTFKSSGPGGQYVNKTESAVRITHIPTGIVVASQTERLQGRNKENAMKILISKLYQLREEQHVKEIKEIKGENISARFGNQIRSYVLHPYKMVKDLRTQYETSDAEGVLNGDLEKFIEAEMKLNDKV